jgi:hypothetical protein
MMVLVDPVLVLDDGCSTASRTLFSSFTGSSGHGSMKGRQFLHHIIVFILLIGVYRLGMLPQIVETRKVLAAMAAEWTFSRMFSNVPGQVL